MRNLPGNASSSFQLLIEPFCCDPVDRRQIRIEHHTLAANQIDRAFDAINPVIVDLASDRHN